MSRFRSLFFAAMLGLAAASNAPGATQPEAKTDTGKVKGTSDGTVSAYLGIPFGAPPVGNLRWKPPAPAAKWSGTRDATKFGSRCMQGRVFDDMIFRDPGISEDCLYLNVWTTAKKGDKLPVMVWVYGGGFVSGATSEPRQEGTNLAKHGVVVVSMNYRLGVFGFFAHADLMAESGRNSAGNYGLLDQVAALEWVKRNIANFGGDPNNVTIFGESAGSFSVSALMASPLTKGLIHKAIGESGAAFAVSGLRFEPAATVAPQHAKFAEESLGAKTIAQARAVPAQKLLDAAMDARKGGTFRFGPGVDGYFLPESVPAIFAAGKQNDIPLIAGWNHDEGDYKTQEGKTPQDQLKDFATKNFGEHADEFLKLHPSSTDEEAIRSLKDAAGDQFIAFSTWRWLEAQRKTGKSHTFRYRFDISHPTDPKRQPNAGAYHSAEIEYVFGELDPENWISWRQEDRTLTEAMQTYWSNFAKAGDPNGPPSLSGTTSKLPPWPAYDADGGWQVLHLDAQIKAEKDSLRDRYLFLESTVKK